MSQIHKIDVANHRDSIPNFWYDLPLYTGLKAVKVKVPKMNMKRPHFLLSTLVALASSTSANPTQLLNEQFDSDLGSFKDISTAITWKTAPANGSTFEVVDGVLQLNENALVTPNPVNGKAGPNMWNADDGILSYSAIDFQFPKAVSHRTNTVTIEWRMRFDAIDQRGESNRIAVMLLHDYPEGGLDLTPDARLTDYSANWWARPAYQVRVRGGSNPPDAAPYMIYGGGHDIDGEFESADLGGTDYWLPGFVSSPGGIAPGGSVSENFPIEGYMMGDTAPGTTTFKRYRYTVEPDRMYLEVNHADDGIIWDNILEMPLPQESEAAQLSPVPPLYRYFEEFEGLRIYLRGPGTSKTNANAFFDYVTVDVDGDFDLGGGTPAGFAAWIDSYPSIPANMRGAQNDPDFDSIENLLEYALGFSPAEPNQMPQAEILEISEQTYLSYSFTKAQADVTYRPSYASNLASGFMDASLETAVVIEENGNDVTVRVPVDHSGSGFFRLEVE